MRLRPYQQKAVDDILSALKTSGSTLAVMPTGCGKTVVFAHVIDAIKGRCMVLAHRAELIHQAVDKIDRITGNRPDIEMANYWADEAALHGPARCVVSSVQSMNAGRSTKRMARFNPADFDLVVFDEAHHATAKTYRNVVEHFKQNPSCKILGVTATPDRGDEEALGQIFEKVSVDYEISDAIDDGWLVPVRQTSIFVEDLDLSDVKTTAGDLDQKQLAKVVEDEGVIRGMAHPTYECSAGRRTIVFTTTVAHAELFADALNSHRSDCARWVCGKTDGEHRRALLRDFTRGDFQFLCNVGVLTEGFDEPGIEVVAVARPTKSRALYCQMVGRGFRPLPGLVDAGYGESLWDQGTGPQTATERREAIRSSAKPHLEVLDFAGNAGRHKLMSAVDILGGKYSDEVVDRAKQIARKDASKDVQETLDEAEKQVHDEAEKKRRRLIRIKSRYSAQTVDPFDVLDVQPWREKPWEKLRRPTEPMVAVLERSGIDAHGMTFTKAKQLIQTIIARREKGLCSYKQAKLLEKYGYDTTMSPAQAREIIGRIASSGWRKGAAPRVPVLVEF